MRVAVSIKKINSEEMEKELLRRIAAEQWKHKF